MELVKCPICEVDDTEILFKQKDLTLKGKEFFNVVKCKRCSLIYINPRPSINELHSYYPDEYDPYNTSESKFLKYITRFIAKQDTKHFKKYLNKEAKILEIGCASGDYLVHLRDFGGWDAYGIELSSYAVDKAKKEYQLNIQEGTLFDTSFENNEFDLVIMRHVLEHIPNINETLQEIKRILKPKGKIMIIVPNVDTIETKVFGSYWWYDIPRHFYNFSPKTVGHIMKKNGFSVYAYNYSIVPNNWIISLGNIINNNNFLCKFNKFFSINNIFLLMIFTPVSVLQYIFSTSGRFRMIVEKR
ncbi:MAG: class I SAM-dependent methyltransferase [Carboxydocellales bacterium]